MKWETAVVLGDILTHVVFLDPQTLGDIQHQVGTLGIQNVYREGGTPAVLNEGLHMPFCGITAALVGGVALHNGTADMIQHRLPEGGGQEILIARLTGMDFYSHIAGKGNTQLTEQI